MNAVCQRMPPVEHFPAFLDFNPMPFAVSREAPTQIRDKKQCAEGQEGLEVLGRQTFMQCFLRLGALSLCVLCEMLFAMVALHVTPHNTQIRNCVA